MDSYEILTQKSIKTGLKIINALDSDELVLSEESYSRLANVKNRIGFFAPFGSFLYGTATENSDFDFKGIYIPYASEFLEDSCQSMRIQPIKQVTRNQSQEILANEKKNVINIKNKKGVKNQPGDIDCEFYPLNTFIKHALSGQTAAFDMLHTPKKLCLLDSDIWKTIVENKKLFLSKRIGRFIGYARNQAKKYGIKGSRLGFLCRLKEYMLRLPENDPLGIYINTIISMSDRFANKENGICISLIPLMNNEDNATFDVCGDFNLHFIADICGKRFPLNRKLKHVLTAIDSMLEPYGVRTMHAASFDGVDWKAISHAFRALSQAEMLATYGEFEYPLPDTDEILEIKSGAIPYALIEPRLERRMDTVMSLVENSNLLPDNPTEETYMFLEGVLHAGFCTYRQKEIQAKRNSNNVIYVNDGL